MSALLETPRGDLEPDGGASDHKLVAAVRRGDDRAFEALYQRYQRRIHAYVLGMVKDHQRAEDVTQEVFVSALRRMRATERPIAFKPWVYEIAKNACIDQFRRSKRAEEVSYNAEDGLAPADYTRLVSNEPVPEKALDSKQQLDHLCGAFGGLSDAHHEILVLRELEGLSYREIGDRMGMSRPAVESTLFRARRRLTEEYDELASGQRCVRIQGIIADADAGSGRLGARDTRRLARHVAHCQPCRRQALAAGVVDAAAVRRRPLRDRAIEKVAGLFPFPLFLRGREWLAQLPFFGDQAAGGAKAAAVAVVVVAGLGAGVGSQVGDGNDESGKAIDTTRAADSRQAPAKPSGKRLTRTATQTKGAAPAAKPERRAKRARGKVRPAGGARVEGSTGTRTPVTKRQQTPSSSGSRPATGGGNPTPATRSGGEGKSGGGSLPSAPQAGSGVGDSVNQTTQAVGNGVQQTTQGLGNTVEQTTQALGNTVDQVAPGAGGVVGGAGSAVGGTVEQLGNTVGGTVEGVGNAVSNTTGGLLGG